MRFRVRAESTAVADARHRLVALIDVPDGLAGLPDQVVADAGLVLSELVTNSVLHAGLNEDDLIEIVLRREEECLVIEVNDRDGLNARAGEHPHGHGDGGMGLKLLDALCSHWHATAGDVVAAIPIHR